VEDGDWVVFVGLVEEMFLGIMEEIYPCIREIKTNLLCGRKTSKNQYCQTEPKLVVIKYS
jgi:hypothetical protein